MSEFFNLVAAVVLFCVETKALKANKCISVCSLMLVSASALMC